MLNQYIFLEICNSTLCTSCNGHTSYTDINNCNNSVCSIQHRKLCTSAVMHLVILNWKNMNVNNAFKFSCPHSSPTDTWVVGAGGGGGGGIRKGLGWRGGQSQYPCAEKPWATHRHKVRTAPAKGGLPHSQHPPFTPPSTSVTAKQSTMCSGKKWHGAL